MDLRDMPAGTDCRLRTGAYGLSAGTRFVTITEVETNGYVTVQTRTPPSKKMIDEGFPKNGMMTIEFDLLQPVRVRPQPAWKVQ